MNPVPRVPNRPSPRATGPLAFIPASPKPGFT